MKSWAFGMILAALVVNVGAASDAFAQPKNPPPPPSTAQGGAAPNPGQQDDICKKILCVPETQIIGRVQKPFVLAEVTKIPPKLTLSELRQPFLDRIEEAVVHDPF